MNKLLCLLLIGSVVAFSDYGYNGSTTATVTIVGGIIKSKHIDKEKKYPRKDCPVCKGSGKYLSGDGIKLVDCGYCVPESKQETEVIHPPIIIRDNNSNCKNKNCRCRNCQCDNCGCLPSVEK